MQNIVSWAIYRLYWTFCFQNFQNSTSTRLCLSLTVADHSVRQIVILHAECPCQVFTRHLDFLHYPKTGRLFISVKEPWLGSKIPLFHYTPLLLFKMGSLSEIHIQNSISCVIKALFGILLSVSEPFFSCTDYLLIAVC